MMQGRQHASCGESSWHVGNETGREMVKTLGLQSTDVEIDFSLAKNMADSLAQLIVGDYICLAWYDRARDQASPSNVNECHDACEVPGYEEYAINRGAELKVVVGRGDFVFCYRPVGDLAGF